MGTRRSAFGHSEEVGGGRRRASGRPRVAEWSQAELSRAETRFDWRVSVWRDSVGEGQGPPSDEKKLEILCDFTTVPTKRSEGENF